MNINETTVLGGLVAFLASGFAWVFKRQIARIDALEKAHTEAQVIRAENSQSLTFMKEALDKHMENEDKAMHDMSETMSKMHESIAVLADRSKHHRRAIDD